MQATDILAGPILRRVERDLVTVWVALSAPATVDIEVFRGQGTRGDLQPVPRRAAAAPTDTQTIRIGEHLHCVVSIWEPAETVGLNPGELYSYDLLILPDGDTPARLGDLGLLSDHAAAPAVAGARLPGRLAAELRHRAQRHRRPQADPGLVPRQHRAGPRCLPAGRRPDPRDAHRRQPAAAPDVPHRRPDLRRRVRRRAARDDPDRQPLPARWAGVDHRRLPRGEDQGARPRTPTLASSSR